jgi:OHCU decarboxylase
MTHSPAGKRYSPPPREMTREEFLSRFGGVYEHSPWIAEAVWRRGVTPAEDTPEGLATALAAAMQSVDDNSKLALIRAHPDLAGRAAVAGELTAASRSEQSGAGLDRCTPEEFRRFHALNDAYKAKFGFPFILAVAGKTREDILDAFEARLGNDREREFRTALAEIDRIALIRLKKLAEP